MNSLYLNYVHNLRGNPEKSSDIRGKDRSSAYLRDPFHSCNDLQKTIIEESSVDVLDYISRNLNLRNSFKNIIFSTRNGSYVDYVDFNRVKSIINFRKINSLKYINEHFRSVNKLLPEGGIYIGRVETYRLRKQRIYKKFGRFFGRIFWRIDFLINRILPKLYGTKSIYYLLKRRVHHSISQAEVLGRLVYCGFKIVGYENIGDLFYFTARKNGEPMRGKSSSAHPLIRLQRVGKNGKLIGVYKFRTMHPYSEHIQDLVIEMNGYNGKGKPANDFRVTAWGNVLRKLWLDELPQIINVLKGEMKLVGIRPVSRVRFNEFPEDLQKDRIRHKPGCFPPYVALGMPDEDGNIEAERIYMRDKTKHPYTTDLKYFLKSVYNIFFNKMRSA